MPWRLVRVDSGGAAILLESSLSYLGYGIQPPTPDWGAILEQGKDYILFAPWISILSLPRKRLGSAPKLFSVRSFS